MFDEENDKRNRTLVYIVIGIIALIVFIVLISSLGNKKKKTEESNPSCIIQFARQADRGSTYTRPVEVSIDATPSKGNTIISKNVGIIENSGKNGEKYTITTNGDVVVKGYAKDSSGKVAKCEKKVRLEMPMPTCTLKVVGETGATKEWYGGQTEIAFDKVESNNNNPIAKQELVVSLVKGASKTIKEGNAILETNGEYVIKGTVENSDGNVGTCTLEVKIDTEPPVCSLKLLKEELSDPTKINVVVGFDTLTDDYSEIEGKGIGINENYSAVEYVINQRGVYTVNGYVKDKAGNKGTCSIAVDTKSKTGPISTPSCTLTVNGTKSYDQTSFCSSATVSFSSKTSTNDAIIREFGIGTIADYEEYNKTGKTFLNGRDSLVVTNNEAGSQTTFVGMVLDSNGEVATCTVNTKVVEKCESQTPVCALYQINSVSSQGKLSEATVGFDASGTYARGNKSIVKYGINTSNSNNLNGKREIVLNKEGSYSIYGIVEDSAGNIGRCGPFNVTITGTRYPTLSSKVKPGDTINYDAGKWSETAPVPTVQGRVGGYTSGRSRGTGVACNYPSTKDGWVVLSNSNGIVKITTKGSPECYYHAIGASAASSISIINGEASKYLNSKYATSATIMTYEEANAILSKTTSGSETEKQIYRDILFTGDYYYLASMGNNSYSVKSVRDQVSGLNTIIDRAGYAQGIRPVVTLKSGVVTTGMINNAYNIDVVN